MRISTLSVTGFRNLNGVSLGLCPGVNLLYGKNGQGKTSLLEAVWLASTGSSFRTARISETIGFDAPASVISVGFESGGREMSAELRLCKNPQSKNFSVNGVSRKPGSEGLLLPTVIFRPEDLELVKAGPNERRALLDTLGLQVSPRYRKNLTEYNRCLAQRNTLLRNLHGRFPGQQDAGILDVLDVALSRLGVYLTRARQVILDKLIPESERLYEGVSGGAEALRMLYASGFGPEPLPSDPSEAELDCCERLASRRREDAGAGFTTLGAHRDDLLFELDGRPARAYGSQGQQRTCAIACRLASARVLGELCGEPPVVLLDDVFSELDPTRCRYILDTVSECQILLTGCDLPLLTALAPEGRELKRILVESGKTFEEI